MILLKWLQLYKVAIPFRVPLEFAKPKVTKINYNLRCQHIELSVVTIKTNLLISTKNISQNIMTNNDSLVLLYLVYGHMY